MSAIEGGALVRGLADGGAVRVIGVDARLAAEEARRVHGLSGSAAELAAQGLLAAALLSAHIKGSERITVQIQASEPMMSFFGEIDAEGGARARVSPTTAGTVDGRMTGILLAIKADDRREMYRGHTEIDHQTLEEALEHHLRTSSQLDAVLRLETRATAGEVTAATGILIERLPEEPGKPSMDAETFAGRYRGIEGGRAEALVEGLRTCKLLDGSFRPLEDRAVTWKCRCSREKVEGMLLGLGVDQLQELIDEDHGAEVTCHFCNSVFRLDEAELRDLVATIA